MDQPPLKRSKSRDMLGRMLHPKRLVKTTWPNLLGNERVQGLQYIKEDVRSINRKEQEVIVFTHELLDGKEVYCAKVWGPSKELGPRPPTTSEENLVSSTGPLLHPSSLPSSAQRFTPASTQQARPSTPSALEGHVRTNATAERRSSAATSGQTMRESMMKMDELLRQQPASQQQPAPQPQQPAQTSAPSQESFEYFSGVQVHITDDLGEIISAEDPDDDEDDDLINIANDISVSNDPVESHGYIFEPASAGIVSCAREEAQGRNFRPHLKKLRPASDPSPYQLFMEFLPLPYIRDVVIPSTNSAISDDEADHLTFAEFLRWIGITFNLACYPQFERKDFWSLAPQNFVFHPPKANAFMPWNRYQRITSSLRTASVDDKPLYHDPAWQVRPLYEAFNDRMATVFAPHFQMCLNESMTLWTPDSSLNWMRVKRKPQPFGNEVHTLACAETRIIVAIELVETRKDRPPQLPPPEFEGEWGKIPSLVLRMTRSVWGTKRIINMDSGFGLVRTLEALMTKNLFGTIILKKKRYWPKASLGEWLKSQLGSAAPGTILVKRCLERSFFLLGYREAQFISLSAHTYGTTNLCPRLRYRYAESGELIKLRYPDVLDQFYKARHAVDDNNNYRMSRLSLEADFDVRDWGKRHFTFILSIVEANAYLMHRHLNRHHPAKCLTHIQFRRELIPRLINNDFFERHQYVSLDSEEPSKSMGPLRDGHRFVAVPPYSGRWIGTGYKKTKAKYQNRPCHVCKKKTTRNVCQCNPGTYLCRDCYEVHIRGPAMGREVDGLFS